MVQVFFQFTVFFLKNTLHRSIKYALKMHQKCTKYARLKHYISIIYKVFAYLHIFLDKVI